MDDGFQMWTKETCPGRKGFCPIILPWQQTEWLTQMESGFWCGQGSGRCEDSAVLCWGDFRGCERQRHSFRLGASALVPQLQLTAAKAESSVTHHTLSAKHWSLCYHSPIPNHSIKQKHVYSEICTESFLESKASVDMSALAIFRLERAHHSRTKKHRGDPEGKGRETLTPVSFWVTPFTGSLSLAHWKGSLRYCFLQEA